MSQVLAIGMIVAVAGGGIFGSNLLHDRGAPNAIVRAATGMAGGFAFLLAALLLDGWIAVALSAAMALFILTLRLGHRRSLRGLHGDIRRNWGEVTYPLAGAFSLGIGGIALDSQWLGFLPIAFMAWGDNTAGMARGSIWRSYSTRHLPSVAMLAVGLALALIAQPYWIGAAGAVVATFAERPRIVSSRIWDDNIAVVGSSLGVMAAVGLATGSI
jgi:hypothetical protein